MRCLDLDALARSLAPVVAVPDELRAATQATWLGRMVNEHGSAAVFEGLAGQLEEAGWAPRDVRECRGFAAEERRHGVLCGAVVVAAGGRAWARVSESPPFPRHEDAETRLEAAARNLVSISCLSETVAVALIGAERDEMPDGPLRALLTTIWADEVGHARFGWRVLARIVPSLSASARERLSRYLAVAFAHVEAHELAHLPLASVHRAGGASLGLCSGSEARELFYATIAHAVVPGLEKLGLPARSAWEGRVSSRAA